MIPGTENHNFGQFLRYYVDCMAEFLLHMLASLVVFLLWLLVVCLIVRPFGIHLPLRFYRKISTSNLTEGQHILVIGVLFWGCGMVIVTTLLKYFDRRLSLGPGILLRSALFPAMGALYGWLTWRATER